MGNLADDVRREVYFTNKNNHEIDTMTDYNGVTTYASDDRGRTYFLSEKKKASKERLG